MPDEESLSREVEEARLNMFIAFDDHVQAQAQDEREAGNESHMSGCLCCCWDCKPAVDALVAAVRKQERAPLVAALRDTAIDFRVDAGGHYMLCELCGAETDVEDMPDYSRAGHAPDCVLAAPVEGGEG